MPKSFFSDNISDIVKNQVTLIRNMHFINDFCMTLGVLKKNKTAFYEKTHPQALLHFHSII
jgi:hypothetical protein